MSNVETLPAHRPALVAGHRPTAIVPTTMDEAYRLANAVCHAGLAPKGLDTPDKAMVAIMVGLEVGLTPMAALQRIAVVNGRTTIWGDGAIGLVRASGLLVSMTEELRGEGDALTAVCTVRRRGEPTDQVRTFSVADARKAGLWGKGGPWQQYPNRMLAMRARAFALRDMFADVLGGLYVREEVEDDAHDPRPVRNPPAPPALAAPAETGIPATDEPAPVRRPPPPPGAQAAPEPEPARERTVADDLEDMERELMAAETDAEFSDAAEPWLQACGEWPMADRERARDIYEKASGRFA